MAKKNITNKTGNFFMQLATVVIGILITFGGSWLIQKSSERKQTVQILSMVRDELGKSIVQIGLEKEVLVYDYAGTKMLNAYMRNPAQISVDSLLKYLNVVMSVKTFRVTTHSFEVLKNSSQIQTIRNKELIRDLFTAYSDINSFYNDVEGYSDFKLNSLNEYILSVDNDMLDAAYGFTNLNISTALGDMNKNPAMRNYIVMTAAGSNVGHIIPAADTLRDEIRRVIEMIDKEISRR